MSASTNFIPSAANASASALPIPLAPPVMTATLPFRSLMADILCSFKKSGIEASEGRMEAWLGQYCINVSDLDAAVKFYETLGLTNTSRTEIPNANKAIMEDAGRKGGKLQLAQQKEQAGPIDHGNAFWKLYVNTNDIDKQYRAAIDGGYASESAPARLEQWPVTIAFLRDPDGYLV